MAMSSGPVSIILIAIIAATTLLVGIQIFGTVDNTFPCSDINNTKGDEACDTAKNTTWSVLKIIPIGLLFLAIGVFGFIKFGAR